MGVKNRISFLVLILVASVSGSSATFGWLADLFGLGSSKQQYSPGFGGIGSSPFGGNRLRRPFGTSHGGGHLGGSSGASIGGSEYLGGGWTGSGNGGYDSYRNGGGFLGGLGLGGIGDGHHPFFRNHQGHQIHRYGHNGGFGGP